MWRFLVGLFAIVGVVSVLLFAGTAYVAYAVISGWATGRRRPSASS